VCVPQLANHVRKVLSLLKRLPSALERLLVHSPRYVLYWQEKERERDDCESCVQGSSLLTIDSDRPMLWYQAMSVFRLGP